MYKDATFIRSTGLRGTCTEVEDQAARANNRGVEVGATIQGTHWRGLSRNSGDVL